MTIKRFATALLLTAATALQAAPPDRKYGLAFEDTFDLPTVDKDKWNFRTDSKVNRFSTQVPENAVIENGQLSLLMKEKPDGKLPWPFTGAGVISKRAFGYGYYEVSSRTTSNKGWHNAFWLMAGDGSDVGAVGRHLEVDAVEIDSHKADYPYYGLHLWKHWKTGFGPDAKYKEDRCPTRKFDASAAAGFRTWGINWSEGKVEFYVDGVKFCTKDYPAETYRQDPVNIWLTNIAYEFPITVGGSPQLFDNVRFYTRDQYVYANREGYSEAGSGWQLASTPGFGQMPQRSSCDVGASATFTPVFQQTGRYRVFVWKSTQADGDSAGQVIVKSSRGTVTKTVDFTSGASGWSDLGVYGFKADDSGSTVRNGSVTIQRTNGCSRASAVKFVRL